MTAAAALITTSNRVFEYPTFSAADEGATRSLDGADVASLGAPIERLPAMDATTLEANEINLKSDWLVRELGRLDSLRGMQDGWESGGASPPNNLAIGLGAKVLIESSYVDLCPTHIDPSTDEGVCISFRRGKKYADIECFNGGDVLAAMSEVDGNSEVWTVEDGSVREALRKIKSFLTGRTGAPQNPLRAA